MENFISIACENASSAPWLFSFMILLAGFNVPISIDIIIISAGALASTCSPDAKVPIFILLFITCWVAAWEAYWLGRLVGPKLYNIKWFSHVLTLKRIERLHLFYEKYGILTFFIGRFIPGGVRNALFMTSGLGKMPFHKFILRDFPACLISVGFLYWLGFIFGNNAKTIIDYFKNYQNIIIVIVLVAVTTTTLIQWKKRHHSNSRSEGQDI